MKLPRLVGLLIFSSALVATGGFAAAQVTGAAPGALGAAPTSGAGGIGAAPGTNTAPGTPTTTGVPGAGGVEEPGVTGLPPGPNLGAPVGQAQNDSIPPIGSDGLSGPNSGIGTAPTFSGANQAGVVGTEPLGTAGLPAPAPVNPAAPAPFTPGGTLTPPNQPPEELPGG